MKTETTVISCILILLLVLVLFAYLDYVEKHKPIDADYYFFGIGRCEKVKACTKWHDETECIYLYSPKEYYAFCDEFINKKCVTERYNYTVSCG